MSYFRRQFSSFEEFQRESSHDVDELGKDEIELLREMEELDDFHRRPRSRRRSAWD